MARTIGFDRIADGEIIDAENEPFPLYYCWTIWLGLSGAFWIGIFSILRIFA